jgi:hypothetical protein
MTTCSGEKWSRTPQARSPVSRRHAAQPAGKPASRAPASCRCSWRSLARSREDVPSRMRQVNRAPSRGKVMLPRRWVTVSEPSKRSSSCNALRGMRTPSCAFFTATALPFRPGRKASDQRQPATIGGHRLEAIPLTLKRAPLSWKRDSSVEMAKMTLPIIAATRRGGSPPSRLPPAAGWESSPPRDPECETGSGRLQRYVRPFVDAEV